LAGLHGLGNRKVGFAGIMCMFGFAYFHGVVLLEKLAPYLAFSAPAAHDQFIGN